MRKFLAILVVLAINLVAAPVGNADDGVGYNGGGSQPSPLSPKVIALGLMKSQFADQYLAFRKAGGAPRANPGGLRPLELALNEGNPFSDANPPINAAGVSPYAYPGNYSSNTLGTTPFQAESPDYYCGPASAWAALSHLGTANNYFGASLTQSNLATSFWLNTTINGTDRSQTTWGHTLNSWTDGTDAGWYLVSNYGYADAADVASKFNLDIDNGYEPIMNVHMNSTRGYLSGWNSSWGDVYHYIPGYGYTQYGDYLNYIEVFSSVGTGYKDGTTKEAFASILSDMGIIW